MTLTMLVELHALLDAVLAPQYQVASDVYQNRCRRLLDLLDHTKALVESSLAEDIRNHEEHHDSKTISATEAR